jgi:hypothetical protein
MTRDFATAKALSLSKYFSSTRSSGETPAGLLMIPSMTPTFVAESTPFSTSSNSGLEPRSKRWIMARAMSRDRMS